MHYFDNLPTQYVISWGALQESYRGTLKHPVHKCCWQPPNLLVVVATFNMHGSSFWAICLTDEIDYALCFIIFDQRFVKLP